MRDSEYNANEYMAANPLFRALDKRMDELLRTMPKVAPKTEQDVYDDAYWSVMEGKDCPFYARNEWRTAVDYPEWDNEQYVPIFCAVKLAASLITATDAERWQIVEDALRKQAEKYANAMADRA